MLCEDMSRVKVSAQRITLETQLKIILAIFAFVVAAVDVLGHVSQIFRDCLTELTTKRAAFKRHAHWKRIDRLRNLQGNNSHNIYE